MQVLINIDDNVYTRLFDNGKELSAYDLLVLARCVRNGTTFPKGHGDLKDADKLKHAFIKWSMAVHGYFTDADIASVVYNSPTVIAADKEDK